VPPDASASTLLALAKATTEPGAIVHTDGLQSYRVLAKHGYDHRRRPQDSAAPGEQLLPRAHRAISNLKAWMHGTHRGVSDAHLQAYLDEYAFRHNRCRTPMAAFQTLLGLGAQHQPISYRDVIDRAA
jgi:transposase-like protein